VRWTTFSTCKTKLPRASWASSSQSFATRRWKECGASRRRASTLTTSISGRWHNSGLTMKVIVTRCGCSVVPSRLIHDTPRHMGMVLQPSENEGLGVPDRSYACGRHPFGEACGFAGTRRYRDAMDGGSHTDAAQWRLSGWSRTHRPSADVQS
jgi:hypothetical protein